MQHRGIASQFHSGDRSLLQLDGRLATRFADAAAQKLAQGGIVADDHDAFPLGILVEHFLKIGEGRGGTQRVLELHLPLVTEFIAHQGGGLGGPL